MAVLKKDNLKSPKKIVAIEIGNDWLKIIESSLGKITKIDCKKLVDIKGKVSDVIHTIFQRLNLNKHDVILCIPRYLATVRILELPSINPNEIRGMVNLQVGKQTPYSKEEIIFDYKVMGEGKKGCSKIMLVIIRRNIIDDRIEALQSAGIAIKNISISSDGLQQWFKLVNQTTQKKEETVILIDMDSNYSDFNVICKGSQIFTRNILIGSNNLLMDRSKWEEKFLNEIVHARELYTYEEGRDQAVRVVLSGSASSVEDLDRLLQLKLKIPVQFINPGKNIPISGKTNIFKFDDFKFISMSPLIGMVTGVQQLDFDLMPHELQIERMMDEKRKQFTVMGGLVAAIVLMGTILILMKIYKKNMYLSQLKQRISSIAKEANAVEKMRLYIDLVENRLSADQRSLNILYEIYKLTPKEIYFTNINLEEGKKIVLQGRAFAMSNVFAFVVTLEDSPFFENVKNTYTTKKKEKNVEYAKFEIVCMFESKEE